MSDKTELLVFEVDETRCALPLGNVVRTELAVAITPLPNAPDIISGMINVHGRIMPVIDTRRRLGLPGQQLRLEDHFILARTEKRELALWVSQVSGIETSSMIPQENVSAVIENLPHISGVTTINEDLVYIHNLEQFLSEEEDRQLDQAIGAVSL
ncbi:chemotaxis protein CheW [Tichowtungia aerotolerans]|uniref:Chemotaxis protein CheW n=1 Tax=Tichowtungia aerotolerans TaxID=2697043 RepID=A0A6P1MAY4_9BACT|nr:chemotaxis protein CheW [Tichowtungia aerotolerans]QHI69704.1 chemotaxis protein CheW [Tichowtungia aerotolerans]